MRKTKLTQRVRDGVFLNGKKPKPLSEAEQAEYNAWLQSEYSMSNFERVHAEPEFIKLCQEFEEYRAKIRLDAAFSEFSKTKPMDIEALKKKILKIFL